MQERWIKGAKEKEIFIRIWSEVEKPVAILQIIHGMAEHTLRYDDFARFMNANNIIVVADDHRGHGKTAEKYDELGFLEPSGFFDIVEDEKIINRIIKEEFQEQENGKIPYYMLGHSFGSFILQYYIQKYSQTIDGAIISGSAKNDGMDVKGGLFLSNIARIVRGGKHKSQLFANMSFDDSKAPWNGTTNLSNAWLSRDEDQVKKYNADPLCGTLFTVGFYHSMLKGLSKAYTNRVDSIRKDLPIFLLSGAEDIIGNFGKKVIALQKMYQDIGVEDVTIKLYEGGRHEMLNEQNNQEVYQDALEFLQSHM